MLAAWLDHVSEGACAGKGRAVPLAAWPKRERTRVPPRYFTAAI